MFKLKIKGNPDSALNRIRKRFNDKSFWYRAKIFFKVRRSERILRKDLKKSRDIMKKSDFIVSLIKTQPTNPNDYTFHIRSANK